MNTIKILWVDDEIDLLKPHILFLEKKNYNVTTCNSGTEAIDILDDTNFDIVFLDENMPGLSGLETLHEIKEKKDSLPVVMITKSEEEYIMEEAIGNKIADYLIKPVNPNQILLSLKKNLDHSRFWEIQLEDIEDVGMFEILESQKNEANTLFSKFIEKNYTNWFKPHTEAPVMSHTLFKEKIAPELSKEQPTLLIVVDNLRYDQWKVFEPIINNYYKKEKEDAFYSILPTATQYARNAIFSGLMPSDMEKLFPEGH